MARKSTDKMLADAVANTEKEIFDEAFSDEPEEKNGDRSLEAMGDDPEGRDIPETDADDEDEAQDDEQEADDESAKDPDDKGEADKAEPAAKGEEDDAGKSRGDLRGALSEERGKRRAVEAERDALRDDFRRLEGRLDETLRRLEQPKKDEPPAPAKPDMFADPEGYERYLRAEIARENALSRVEMTFAEAHETHGKAFEEAQAALNRLDRSNPSDRATVQRIANAPNPGKALMKWAGEQKTLREVGADPNAWLERKLEERLNDPAFLEKAMQKAQERARGGNNDTRQNGGSPRTITRIPKSLNGAAGGREGNDPGLYDNSERSVFDYATR